MINIRNDKECPISGKKLTSFKLNLIVKKNPSIIRRACSERARALSMLVVPPGLEPIVYIVDYQCFMIYHGTL